MARLYLDFNIISYLRTGRQPSLTAAFSKAAESELVVFSPAHLEDIAASAIRARTAQATIDSEIAFLEKIAGRNALRPTTRDRVIIYDESPRDCYARVINQYGKNDLAEWIDAAVLADAHDSPAGSPIEKNNIAPEKILAPKGYRESIVRSLVRQGLIGTDERAEALSWRFDELEGRFSVLEAYINLAANLLEKIGYHRESRDRSRARLHDVSHIIYAAHCEKFVTADKKLRMKARAIYSLLGIGTVVLSDTEFVDQQSP